MTKQRDLSGFYRHLYHQTFAEEPKKTEPEEPVTFKKEPVESEFKSRRQYRARREEEEEEEEEEEVTVKKEEEEDTTANVSNELAVDQKISDAGGKSKSDRRPAASASLVSAAASDRAAAADRAAEKATPAAKPTTATTKTRPKSDSEESDEDKSNPASPEPAEVIQPKVKVDIWKKRTVGQLLEEAIERYQARKAAREQAMVS